MISNDFKMELTSLINRFGLESLSDTPDYILAEYLIGCLKTFNETTKKRIQWYTDSVVIKKETG